MTNKLRSAYAKASKSDKASVHDDVMVMLNLGLPLMAETGDLDRPSTTMRSAATIDRYLTPARKRMQLRGIWTPVRDSIGLSKVGYARPTRPRVIEAMAAGRHLDIASFNPSISPLQTE
ncbi:MAG: hypothetical protein ACTHZ9_07905 [Leucobacter sp.]